MRRRRNNERIMLAISIAAFAVALILAFMLTKTEHRASYSLPESGSVFVFNNNGQESKSDTADKTAYKPTLRETLGLSDEEMEYLVLVNFDNGFEGSGIDLVHNSEVFDSSICTYHNRFCNETAGQALNEMMQEGYDAGLGRFIVNSSYRDRREQTEIWNEKRAKDPTYGDNPYENPVRAMPPGKSEHETGLAFDVLTENHPYANKWFGTFDDGIWLRENCAEYGFILRYPEDKTHITGVQYEPWHFRYVGKTAAKYMYENGICLEEFIDLLNIGC